MFFFQADPWPSGKLAWASSRDAAGPAWGGGKNQPGGEVLPSYFLYSYAQRMEVHESLYLADVDITLMELVDLHRRMAVPEYVSLCLD